MSLVSTIIPVRNRAGMLIESVNSVLRQDYRPIEIVIVDDGSEDETVATADELASSNRGIVKTIHIENSGPGQARQVGLEKSTGEFIQFLDSDDLLLPAKFNKQVNALMVNPNYSISYGKTREYKIGERPKDVPARRTGEKFITLFPALLNGRIWATNTPLYRRWILQEIGTWSRLRMYEDWEYECRLGAENVNLIYIDEFVADVRHHDGEREGLKWVEDDDTFKDMLKAHEMVLEYAFKAGVSRNSDEMKRFARNLFRLAREAGKRGFSAEADVMLSKAVSIDQSKEKEYQLYRKIAGVIGWKMAYVAGEKLAKTRRNMHCRTSGNGGASM